MNDPSQTSLPIDDDPPVNTPATPAQSQDNRGSPKDGQFTASGMNKTSAVTTLIFGMVVAEAEFQVTLQPGDNFRVVATCVDQTAPIPSLDLTHVQAQQNDGTMARVKEALGNFIE